MHVYLTPLTHSVKMKKEFPLATSPIQIATRGICKSLRLALSAIYFKPGDITLKAYFKVQYPSLIIVIMCLLPYYRSCYLQYKQRASAYSEREFIHHVSLNAFRLSLKICIYITVSWIIHGNRMIHFIHAVIFFLGSFP